MMERHNGVFGGCWCTYVQTLQGDKTYDADDNRSLKQRLVEEDTTDGRTVSVLYDGTRRVFEEAGFTYVRPKGLRNCVLRARV